MPCWAWLSAIPAAVEGLSNFIPKATGLSARAPHHKGVPAARRPGVQLNDNPITEELLERYRPWVRDSRDAMALSMMAVAVYVPLCIWLYPMSPVPLLLQRGVGLSGRA